MNIVLVGSAFPLRGGIAHYNALLFQALQESHSVEVITFTRQYPTLLFPGSSQQEEAGEMLRVPALPMVDSINPFNWIAVGRAIRKRKPDLVIFKYWLPFFGPCFGTIARVAKRNSHTRVLCICDNVVPHERRPGDTLFTRYLFGAVDCYIVQSEAVERDLLDMIPNARYRRVAHPVYNIFGEKKAKAIARTELDLTASRILLFFGYVRRYKGLHLLLDAFALLNPDLGIQLLVVGEFYDSEEEYRKHIAELRLEHRVSVMSSYIPNDRVGTYFSAADAIVLPYLSATQSGIAQIAYNFDRPVIATNVGGLAEVVVDGETGFVVPPHDAAALAESITRFYREHREESFATRVAEVKKNYSWSTLVHAIEEMVQS